MLGMRAIAAGSVARSDRSERRSAFRREADSATCDVAEERREPGEGRNRRRPDETEDYCLGDVVVPAAAVAGRAALCRANGAGCPGAALQAEARRLSPDQC